MTVSWNIDPGQYFAAITRQRADAIEHDVVRLIDDMTDQVTAWMQANHRWQNRTGAAEAGLHAGIEYAVRQGVWLVMAHGVDIEYAWFLEASPRTALLGDATDHWLPVIMRGVQEIVRRHSY